MVRRLINQEFLDCCLLINSQISLFTMLTASYLWFKGIKATLLVRLPDCADMGVIYTNDFCNLLV